MMADASEKVKLVANAKREFNGLKQKKTKVTKNVNKCQQLLDQCRVESPLTLTSAEDALSIYSRTQICMNELETSVEYYLELMAQTYEDPPAREPQEIEQDGAAAPEIDHLQELIDTHSNEVTAYSTRVINLRANNLETFRAIDRALNPVNPRIAPQAQAAPPVAPSGDFRLNTDLRPPILQKDCTFR